MSTSRKRLWRALVAWFALTSAAGFASYKAMDLHEDYPRVPEELGRWAIARLGSGLGDAPQASPQRAHTIVIAWKAGFPVSRFEGNDFNETIMGAEAAFRKDSKLLQLAGDAPTIYTVTVVGPQGPLITDLMYLSQISLVPLNEGVRASFGDKTLYITPGELRADGAYESGIVTPIPDLSVGIDVPGLIGKIARDFGVDRKTFLDQGVLRRFRAQTFLEEPYPGDDSVTEESLRQAAVDGAHFLLRHQARDGRYTYVYDARSGSDREEHYNIPRHSGTSYFLAQVHHLHGLQEAREGALKALRWLRRKHSRKCGEHLCIADGTHANVGSAALTVVAASEVLASGDDPDARVLVEGLTAFLRSLQREDGELMHEFDLSKNEPIDVQHMYYSGEAAFALLRAHKVLGDPQNLEAAKRLMSHLTGDGWNFFGSRYYYGEEHWTCIAAGESTGRIESPAAMDFCERWAGFNDAIQYRDGQTPWKSKGAYGVGPLIMPRLTPVGSRSEAFIGTYQLLEHHKQPRAHVRSLIERGLSMLLRWRWAPGPTFAFRNPLGAYGGVPGAPSDTTSRNDFVQHAGSAWIRWADQLKRERLKETKTAN